MNSGVDRRRFLKYVGAGIAGVAAAGAGYYLYDRQRAYIPATSQATTVTSASQATIITSMKINSPPVVSGIRVKPEWINPTSEYTVELSYDGYDPDNDPLNTTWLIDGKEGGHENKYATKLPEGAHDIILKVCDVADNRTLSETTRYRTITVETDQIYPTRQLHIKHKGMRMMVGWKGMPHTPIDITDEKLDIIQNELGCNAVIIFGNTEFEDDLIEAGRLAIQKGFDRIYIAPMYLDVPLDETVENIGKFARKVRDLRQMSESIVFMVGHEFTFDSYGLVPGETYPERLAYPFEHSHWDARVKAALPGAFKRIIGLCEDKYGYQITYAATVGECESNLVPWSHPIFESVCTNAYLYDKIGWTESWIIKHLSGLKIFRKPVNSTEWGCLTYEGASREWGFTDEDLARYPYDEDEQARYIARYCNMLNKAKIDGAFYTQFDDERLKGYGLYSANVGLYSGKKRKKGFYMYKSYQRTL